MKSNGSEAERWKYGLGAVLGGFAVLLVCYLAAIMKFDAPGDAATAMAAVTGAIGTMAGAYFGVQVGSAGRQEAENRADVNAERAVRFAAIADPARAMMLLNLPDSPDDGDGGGGPGGVAEAPSAGSSLKEDRDRSTAETAEPTWTLVEDEPAPVVHVRAPADAEEKQMQAGSGPVSI